MIRKPTISIEVMMRNMNFHYNETRLIHRRMITENNNEEQLNDLRRQISVQYELAHKYQNMLRNQNV